MQNLLYFQLLIHEDYGHFSVFLTIYGSDNQSAACPHQKTQSYMESPNYDPYVCFSLSAL